MRRILSIASVLFIARLAAAAQAPALTDSEIVARVQRVIEYGVTRKDAEGLSVAVGRDDKLVVERGAGMADLESDTEANAATMFRIGSVTKQFTAAGIMKLVERGKLGLDDELSKYVPQFDTGGRKVTIRQLLNHASGIPNFNALPAFIKDYGPARDLTHEQMLEYLKGVPFDFEPGAGWNYSNSGYYLLGMVIEAVDGRTYARFLQDEFFTPLGLTRTRYALEREIVRNRAQGYSLDRASGERVNDALISMQPAGAAGGLSSSAGDLVRWQIALTGGRVVTAASYRQMVESSVAATGGVRYGFGLSIAETGGPRRVFHTGSTAGFNSVLIYLPASGLHLAVISNSETLPSEGVANLIVQALGGGEALSLRATQQPGSEAALRRLFSEVIRGELDYDRMGPQLAAAMRQQLAGMQSNLRPMGEIQSVAFVEVDLAGLDRYDVKLANGALRVGIRLDQEGKVVSAQVQPAGR